jgi:hypothetical protein
VEYQQPDKTYRRIENIYLYPVLVTLSTQALNQEKQPSLCNRHTNWDEFRHLINERLTLNVSLKTEEKLNKQVSSSMTIQWAGWKAMPENTGTSKTYQCPILIKQKIIEKKKEDSVEAGTDYEHHRANDYSTQQHRNSNNSSSATKTTASKHSYKALHLWISTDYSL